MTLTVRPPVRVVFFRGRTTAPARPPLWAVFDANGTQLTEKLPREEAHDAADRIAAANAGVNRRKCMCCSRPFLSEGHHNRLCNTCRSSPNTLDQSYPIGTR